MAEIERVSNGEFMEEVARYEYVYLRNSKDFKDKNKRPTFRAKPARSLIYRLGKWRPNFWVRSLSNPKPMFLTVLELMTTSLHDKQKR